MLPLILTSIGFLRLFGIPIVLILLILLIIRKRKIFSDIEETKKYIYQDAPKPDDNLFLI